MSAIGLVGRDAELNLLDDLVTEVVAGTGHAILIEGEPGIGKSSLAHATATLAEQRGCRTYWAAADELGQALPLRPVLDAFQSLDSAGEARLEMVRRLLRGEFGNTLEPVAAASEQLFALVTELCGRAATLLVVDDLQWADNATISLWERLAQLINRRPLLLVGLTRPIPHRAELALIQRAAGRVLTLERLPDHAVTSLVTELSHGRPGTGLLQVAADAAGNPLYLTELVAALLRADRLETNDAGEVEVTTGPVPKSLLAAIADRLDFLRSEVREMLQAAALLGIEFLVADLAVVRNCRVADLVRAITQARMAGVLEEVDERLRFRHPLIRAALYDEIAPPVRAAWHGDAAKALANAGVPVHRVAKQLLQAFTSPDANPLDVSLLEWLTKAASTLVAQTPRTAIDLLREACRHSPITTQQGAWLTARLAEALYRSGKCGEAERIARQAMVVTSDTDLLVDLHWTVAQCRGHEGRTDESLESLNQAIALPDVSLQQHARLLVAAARAHRNLGQVTVAGDMATKALAIAEDVGDTWAVGWSLHVLIVVAMMRGEVASALPLFERALDVAGGNSALSDLGLLLQINKSVALGELDRLDEAMGAARSVRQQADRTGSMVRLGQARSALGDLLFEAGQWDAAQDEVEALSDDVKDPGTTCCDRGFAALIAFHRGDMVTAEKHLKSAGASAEQIGDRVVSSLVLARSLEYECADKPAAALAVLLACLTDHKEELDEMEALLPEAARLAAWVKNNEELRRVTAQAVTLAQRSGVPHRLGAVAFCRGLLDGSSSLLLLAGEQYADAGRPLLQAKALEAAANQLAERGDRGAARSAFVRADEVYEQLGATWDLARLRAGFRRYGIRRGPRNKHRQVLSGWDSLTPSEAKVAGLVAEGLSNKQIAERLVLSTRTVESHVSHILAKLAMRSRVEIARRVAN